MDMELCVEVVPGVVRVFVAIVGEVEFFVFFGVFGVDLVCSISLAFVAAIGVEPHFALAVVSLGIA
jgi:hypothetical protein